MIEQSYKHCPMRNLSSVATVESSVTSETRATPLKASSKKVPKIRRVKEYIIFYDEVLG